MTFKVGETVVYPNHGAAVIEDIETRSPIELIAMGSAALFVGFVIRDGRARRWEGALLISVYGGFVVWFLAAGDR